MIVQITPPAIANIGWKTYIIFAVLNTLWLPIIAFFFPETKGKLQRYNLLGDYGLTVEQALSSKMSIDYSRRTMVLWMLCMKRRLMSSRLRRREPTCLDWMRHSTKVSLEGPDVLHID